MQPEACVLGQGGFGRAIAVNVPAIGGGPGIPAVVKVISHAQLADNQNCSPAMAAWHARFEARAHAAMAGCRTTAVLYGHGEEQLDTGACTVLLLERAAASLQDIIMAALSRNSSSNSSSGSTLLPEGTIGRIAANIASALDYMHVRGLEHGDVKPHNILLRSDGTPLLADFAVVHEMEVDGLGIPHAVPGWSPPEASATNMCSGRNVDMWALGLTLLHAALGPEQALVLGTCDVAGALRGVGASEPLVDLVCLLLAPNVQQRMCSAAAVMQHPFVLGVAE